VKLYLNGYSALHTPIATTNIRFRRHIAARSAGIFESTILACTVTEAKTQEKHRRDRVFEVIHTPGHSPGGIALYENKTGIDPYALALTAPFAGMALRRRHHSATPWAETGSSSLRSGAPVRQREARSFPASERR
jgi:glyoxylase-like metal-dependent hydrolase (beta-lactamase superfamily II)